ncbi:MAG: hypothetical protein HYU56_02590 [Candidatus Aenigmarchaeota archaeon]|nr:hypothetical protein [Candidatus Aenigmarchaeota archaeon]
MSDRYRGVLQLESLNNTEVFPYLNLRPIKTRRGYNPEADAKHRIVLIVDTPADDIQSTTERLSKELRPGWHALFWNDAGKHVVFRGKVFELPLKEEDAPEKYAEARRHGTADGVQVQYLGFQPPVH